MLDEAMAEAVRAQPFLSIAETHAMSHREHRLRSELTGTTRSSTPCPTSSPTRRRARGIPKRRRAWARVAPPERRLLLSGDHRLLNSPPPSGDHRLLPALHPESPAARHRVCCTKGLDMTNATATATNAAPPIPRQPGTRSSRCCSACSSPCSTRRSSTSRCRRSARRSTPPSRPCRGSSRATPSPSASTLIPAGRIGDRIGHKWVYFTGVAALHARVARLRHRAERHAARRVPRRPGARRRHLRARRDRVHPVALPGAIARQGLRHHGRRHRRLVGARPDHRRPDHPGLRRRERLASRVLRQPAVRHHHPDRRRDPAAQARPESVPAPRPRASTGSASCWSRPPSSPCSCR